MLRIQQRIFMGNIKLVKINVMQEHIDTTKVVRSQIDFLTIKTPLPQDAGQLPGRRGFYRLLIFLSHDGRRDKYSAQHHRQHQHDLPIEPDKVRRYPPQQHENHRPAHRYQEKAPPQGFRDVRPVSVVEIDAADTHVESPAGILAEPNTVIDGRQLLRHEEKGPDSHDQHRGIHEQQTHGQVKQRQPQPLPEEKEERHLPQGQGQAGEVPDGALLFDTLSLYPLLL